MHVGCLSEPSVLRAALEALTFLLDGSWAAANTVIRKRAVLHGALGHAAEARLLPDNPLDNFSWRVPQSSAALDPAVVASPAQVGALLDAVDRARPELTAFFGCLYYVALRPEEAVALCLSDCHLPGTGWGLLRLAAATTRTAAAWTDSGASHDQRGLKHRPDGGDPDGPGTSGAGHGAPRARHGLRHRTRRRARRSRNRSRPRPVPRPRLCARPAPGGDPVTSKQSPARRHRVAQKRNPLPGSPLFGVLVMLATRAAFATRVGQRLRY